MPKPKRFTKQAFKVHLETTIDELIDEKRAGDEVYLQDVQVKDIADKLDVHPVTLRRWCHEYCNKNPHRYLSDYRIGKAKLMLKKGVSPTKLSELLGYTDYKIFAASFKKITKTSPSEYLKFN